MRKVEGNLFWEYEEEEVPVVRGDQGKFVLRRKS